MSAEPGMSPERESVFEDFSGFEPEQITVPQSIEKSVADALFVEIDRSRSRGPEGEADARRMEKQVDALIFDTAILALDKVPRKPTEGGGFEIPADYLQEQDLVATQEIPAKIESVGEARRRNTKDRIKLHAKKMVIAGLLGLSTVFAAFGTGKSAIESSARKAAVLSEMKEDTARLKAKNLAEQSDARAQTGGLTMAERVAASAKGVTEIPEEEVMMAGKTIQGSKEAVQAGRRHVVSERLATAKKMYEELLVSGKDLDTALEESTADTGETEMASIHDVDRPGAEEPDQPIKDTGTTIASDY